MSISGTIKEINKKSYCYCKSKCKRYKSKYGFAVQSGRNYRLHKRPIGDMVGINIDFMPLDLSADFYEADKGGRRIIED